MANLYDAARALSDDVHRLLERPSAVLPQLVDFTNGPLTAMAAKEVRFLRGIAQYPDSAAAQAVREEYAAGVQREAKSRLGPESEAILAFSAKVLELGKRVVAFVERVRVAATRQPAISQAEYEALLRERIALTAEYTQAKDWMDNKETQLAQVRAEVVAAVERLGREAEEKINAPTK